MSLHPNRYEIQVRFVGQDWELPYWNSSLTADSGAEFDRAAAIAAAGRLASRVSGTFSNGQVLQAVRLVSINQLISRQTSTVWSSEDQPGS